MNIQIKEESYTQLQFATMAFRGLSDLLLNMEHEKDLHMVRPENLQALMDVLADNFQRHLDQAIE